MFQISQKAEYSLFLHFFVLFGLLVEWMSPIQLGRTIGLLGPPILTLVSSVSTLTHTHLKKCCSTRYLGKLWSSQRSHVKLSHILFILYIQITAKMPPWVIVTNCIITILKKKVQHEYAALSLKFGPHAISVLTDLMICVLFSPSHVYLFFLKIKKN